MKKVSLFFILILVSIVAQAKDIAFIVGGGGESNENFVIPPANNWYFGLKNLGWDVEIYFGDAFETLPNITVEQHPFESEKVLARLKTLGNTLERNDNIFFVLITHGTRCIRFNSESIEDELQDEQVVLSGDLHSPIQPILLELARLDKLNGKKGKVFFWNHSCFSGVSMADLKNTGVCSVTIAGENQVGFSGNFGDWISYQLAGRNSKYSESFSTTGVKKTETMHFTLQSLLTQYLPLDTVTPAVYSNGFNLNYLNVEDHAVFLRRFSTLFPRFPIAESTMKAFDVEPVANDTPEILPKITSNQKNMMNVLRQNRAFIEQLELETIDLALSYVKNDHTKSKMPDEFIRSKIRESGEIAGRAASYYEIAERIAHWLFQEVKPSLWTVQELRSKITNDTIGNSGYLNSMDYDFRSPVSRLYPLLTNEDLQAMHSFVVETNRIRSEQRKMPGMRFSPPEELHRPYPSVTEERNRFFGYAIANTPSDCGKFNLKRN